MKVETPWLRTERTIAEKKAEFAVVRVSMRQDEAATYVAAWQSIDCLKGAGNSYVTRSV